MTNYRSLRRAAYAGLAAVVSCVGIKALKPIINSVVSSPYTRFERDLERSGVHMGYRDEENGVVGFVLTWPSPADRGTMTFNPNSRALRSERKTVEEKVRELAPRYGFGVKAVTNVRFGTGGTAIVYAVLERN